MNLEKIINLLHMARKAGKVEFGLDACKRACFHRASNLIILATDLNEKKKTEMQDVAGANNVKCVEMGTKSDFGIAFNLRDLGIISVEDVNFANGIKKWL
ncbi:MAG TPA: ribosomal L7Ae/L30e/S12e/Gadd45 family protein [Candidatus Cloacimonadota bacterium]|nr:ribosomal L7Ae/L30e/S12e/Gadd45 family protein [Candidatus Cloacimonadota bacterium]